MTRDLLRERRRLHAMILRCHLETDPAYKNYGGRGIKVCQRWQDSFAAFHEDMGFPPTPKHSIDRIDVNGDYCPENCRWATATEQMNNTRRTIRLTLDGRTMGVAAWSRETGLMDSTIKFRKQLGWADEDTLTMPSNYFDEQRRLFIALGGYWSQDFGVRDFPPRWYERRPLLIKGFRLKPNRKAIRESLARLERHGLIQRTEFQPGHGRRIVLT